MTDYSVGTNIKYVAKALEDIAREFKRMNDRNAQLDADAAAEKEWS